MNILFLGPERPALISFMSALGDNIIQTEDRLKAEMDIVKRSEWLVSFGYRAIIPESILNLFPGKAINLHISYLPYNKGADPNLWSFIDDTPKGVTIHRMLPEVDAGEILARREVSMSISDTLRTSYEKLSSAIEDLFIESWPLIRTGDQTSFPQETGGTCHRLRDKEKVAHLLLEGWDTPVSQLTQQGCSITEE